MERYMQNGHQAVSLDSIHDILYWTREFRCTKEELVRAVLAVGTSPEKVREFLYALKDHHRPAA
ncbi:MAG: DUF3606 domain-containing protein [Bacteroidota bacterium]